MKAIFSIINYQHLHAGLDFDAEHYHPDRLRAWACLSKNSRRTIADFFTEIIDIRNARSDDQVFDLTDAVGNFLSRDRKGSGISQKKAARPDDIIISRLRSYLQEACVIPARCTDYTPLLSTEFLVFRAENGDGAWLLPFLLSKQVQTVLHWAQTGNNHPRFSSKIALALPIAEKVLSMRQKLAKITLSALDCFEKSVSFYPEAEAELLERMGWAELSKRKSELFYTESFSALEAHERIDAEHYQPKYKRLLEQLKKIGSVALGSLLWSCDKGTQPDEYDDEGEVVVVKSKNVFGEGIELTFCERTSLRAWGDKQARLEENNLVVNSTGVGTLGRAGVIHGVKDKIVASVDLLILRLREEMIDPDYLALFLNSPAGLAQSEQFQTGSSGQLHLYPEHIRRFFIFVPRNRDGSVDLAWQRKLADKVRIAGRAKVDARAKLEEAKQIVESAISG